MKGESNATASNWFTQPCWNAGAHVLHSLVPLPRLFAWHGEQLHATHLLFAQTNEFEQPADKDPVYNPGNC